MKTIAFVLLLLLSSGACTSQEEPAEFLSWYDGWGIHSVWGAGNASGSYRGTHVKCGDRLVPVRAIHDTHESDGNSLSQAQTAEFARSKNLVLLATLESTGDKCIFQHGSSSET